MPSQEEASTSQFLRAAIIEVQDKASQVAPVGDHWCPVKYFAKSGKSFAIHRIAGIRLENDLN